MIIDKCYKNIEYYLMLFYARISHLYINKNTIVFYGGCIKRFSPFPDADKQENKRFYPCFIIR